MTDFAHTENDPISIDHFYWLGFTYNKGALTKIGFDGEIQYIANVFWYCKDNTAVKRIIICKDINDIYLEQTQN